jgi:hypothetical protein
VFFKNYISFQCKLNLSFWKKFILTFNLNE